MTSTVDEFLSSLSQISQTRLREDDKRKRDLQRKVDELRLRLSSPTKSTYSRYGLLTASLSATPKLQPDSDKFFRDLDDMDDEANAPPLPKRNDNPPELPKRRYENGPDLPRRRYQLHDSQEDEASASADDRNERFGRSFDNTRDSMRESYTLDTPSRVKKAPPKPTKKDRFDVELLYPVARKDNDQSVEKTTTSTETYAAISTTRFDDSNAQREKYAAIYASRFEPGEKKYRSFVDIESDILSGRGVENTPSRPQKPSKPAAFTSKIEELDSHEQPYSNMDDSEESTYSQLHAGKDNSKPEKPRKPGNMSSSTAPSKTWVPPNSKAEPPTSSGPVPLFPQRNMYYSLLSVKKGNEKPPKPAKLSAGDDKPNYKIEKQPDWLSSSMTNKATTSTQQDATTKPDTRTAPIVPTKSDWLSSSLSNSRTTSTQQDQSREVGGVSRSPSKADWMTSLANSKATQQQKASVPATSPIKSPQRKQSSWIESALKKSDTHKYIEPVEPSFKIVKKDTPLPKVEEKTPELFSRFEKLRSSLPEKIPTSPKRTVKEPTPEPELLSKLAKIKKSDREPNVGAKNDKLPEEESELLKSTMSKLSSAKPPKPSKKPVTNYTKDESDLLKSTMSRLSPSKPTTGKPSLEKFTKNEEDLLSLTMSRLSAKKVPVEKPSLDKYENNDAEMVRSQLKLLGSKNVKYKELQKEQENIEGLAQLKKLKQVKKDAEEKKAPPKPEKRILLNSEPDKKPSKPEKPTQLKIESKPALKSPSVTESNSVQSSATTSVTSFQDQLSSILLRTGTAPELGGSAPFGPIKRSNTEPKRDVVNSEKLTHPNKSRAKGPKRRLPKAQKTSSERTEKAKTSPMTSPNEPKDDKVKAKPKPKPKPKPLELKPVECKPSRSFSGEIFI